MHFPVCIVVGGEARPVSKILVHEFFRKLSQMVVQHNGIGYEVVPTFVPDWAAFKYFTGVSGASGTYYLARALLLTLEIDGDDYKIVVSWVTKDNDLVTFQKLGNQLTTRKSVDNNTIKEDGIDAQLLVFSTGTHPTLTGLNPRDLEL